MLNQFVELDWVLLMVFWFNHVENAYRMMLNWKMVCGQFEVQRNFMRMNECDSSKNRVIHTHTHKYSHRTYLSEVQSNASVFHLFKTWLADFIWCISPNAMSFLHLCLTFTDPLKWVGICVCAAETQIKEFRLKTIWN